MAHRHKVHAAAHGKRPQTDDAEEHEVEHEAHLKRGGAAKHKAGGKVHGKKHNHRFAKGGKVHGYDGPIWSSAHGKK
jgi:hypothetical protein